MTSTPYFVPTLISRRLYRAGLISRPIARRKEGARRILNVAVAAAGAVVAMPLMALIAVAIKLTSRGPVLFVQNRVGLDRRTPGGDTNHRRNIDYGGKPFRMYKFRTMRWQPADSSAVWAQPNDPRVTPVGKVLRQFRLDELPQLFNVLRGDMNVVGPRPEQPDIAVRLRLQVPGWAARQQVRPGITGWAQINNNYDQTIDDVKRKVAHDLEYLERHSLMEDLMIMVRTAPVVAFRKGAW